MSRFLKSLLSRRGDEFAETAIAMPVVVLITIALLNLTMAGFASVNTNNAANYGARVGSVPGQCGLRRRDAIHRLRQDRRLLRQSM